MVGYAVGIGGVGHSKWPVAALPRARMFAMSGQCRWAPELHLLRGWSDSCLPVICGQPQRPAYAEPTKDAGESVFPETVDFLCEQGFEVEGFGSTWDLASISGQLNSSTTTTTSGARLVRWRCSAQGVFENLTGQRCVPVCGDGMLVPTDHLPWDDPREQCDDGNNNAGDGCSGCRVEAGFVCTGGGPTQPDRCTLAAAWAESTIILSLTGARQPTAEEVALSSTVALAETFHCPQRDVEIVEVIAPSMATTSNVSDESTANQSQFHTSRQAMQVRFRIKISDSAVLSLDGIQEAMASQNFVPQILVAYMQHTSLTDLYLSMVEVQQPTLEGQEAKMVFLDVQDYVVLAGSICASLLGYACLIGLVMPTLYWCAFVARRPSRLQGYTQYIPEEHQTGWLFGTCDWYKSKVTCCSLIVLLPARLAYTWDTVGIVPYWKGVRQAMMCCGLYLLGCWPCGAFIAGQNRSDLKDFLGFGDGVKSNIEMADICWYILCPICSVVQEAAHVDKVFAAVRAVVAAEAAEKAKAKHQEDEDEEKPIEVPTLQSMFDEGINAALDTAVGAFD
ncbi:unnamed protein product [Effrenium voratum]|uniref:Uncharacterized protein n=1 Tax=Effrenium voratum TaxID=2562239 RepID=A0AA36N4P6_9DINO|nr:unnamed protein product [Effrenium voratum]